jgi:hypothetical protein
MDLITNSNLCEILGFDLDAEFGNVRRYAKTEIKHVKGQIQDALDAVAGEVLEPIGNITDKIEESVNDLMGVIDTDPFSSAANTILSCIGINLTSYNYSLSLPNWKDMLDKWLMGILDSYLTSYEKLLWGYLDYLESAFSPYTLDKIMALAACLIGCPGVSGATTPGPDGWGVVTPQGWVYINESDFTDLINTVGLGIDGNVEFDEFGASGASHGTRIRTIQDDKNKAVGALAAVATGSVAPNSESQQVITDYGTLVTDVGEAYEIYLGINEDIIEYIVLANEEIKEVDIYIAKVYKLGNYSYRAVADNGKTKMQSIYVGIGTYQSNAIANNASALTAYNDLDLTTLQTLNITNGGYKTSANIDKNRIKSVKEIVRDMANALEDKGTIEAISVGGVSSRGREAVKEAIGTGSYKEEIDAI